MKNKYLLLSDAKSPHTLKWVKELVKYYDIYIVTLNGYDDELLKYITKEKIYSLNESVNREGGNIKLLLKFFEINNIVKKLKPIYINAHYLSSYGVIGAFLKKNNQNIKLIQSTWGTDILVTPHDNYIRLLFARFALKNADLITSDSLFMSDEINKIYNNDKTITFPFGLDKRIDKKIKYTKDKFLIFSNRALSKNYNIDTIIKWFATLDNRYKLIIANDGNMKEELMYLASQLGVFNRIKFVGFLSAKQQAYYYKKSSYYISIPSSDSTAVSLLEAMSLGCYPIVSNLPANREWIIDGFNGVYFYHGMPLENNIEDVIEINQTIINKKAIFSENIKYFIKILDKK